MSVSFIRSTMACLVVALGMVFGSCATTSVMDDKYADAWQNVLESKAWKEALLAENLSRPKSTVREASKEMIAPPAGHHTIAADVRPYGNEGGDRYRYLVTRAYIKVIAEAEKANARLKAVYDRWEEKMADPDYGNNPERIARFKTIKKGYLAHRRMLEGLRSWKALDAYGTDDLKFFGEEYIVQMQDMMDQGKDDAAIVSFLVYRLADLYHFEEPLLP